MALAHQHDATLETGWGGSNSVPWRLHTSMMPRYKQGGVEWGGAINVPWHLREYKYVATLAYVVNIREQRNDVTLMEYVATLAHVVNMCERPRT